MDLSLILGFAAMAAVIEVSPGPNFLLVLRSVPTFGKTGAFANCIGFATSYLLHGALAIFGVSALIAAQPILLLVIQVAGACYLLYLGVKALSPARQSRKNPNSPSPPVDILLLHNTVCIDGNCSMADDNHDHLAKTPAAMNRSSPSLDIVLDEDRPQSGVQGLSGCFTQGVLISAFNPKITLFYVAAFPQFILAGSNAVSNSFFLVLIHVAICVFWTTLVALVLSYLLNRNSNFDLVGKLNVVSGIALIGLSMTFFTSAAQAI